MPEPSAATIATSVVAVCALIAAIVGWFVVAKLNRQNALLSTKLAAELAKQTALEIADRAAHLARGNNDAQRALRVMEDTGNEHGTIVQMQQYCSYAEQELSQQAQGGHNIDGRAWVLLYATYVKNNIEEGVLSKAMTSWDTFKSMRCQGQLEALQLHPLTQWQRGAVHLTGVYAADGRLRQRALTATAAFGLFHFGHLQRENMRNAAEAKVVMHTAFPWIFQLYDWAVSKETAEVIPPPMQRLYRLCRDVPHNLWPLPHHTTPNALITIRDWAHLDSTAATEEYRVAAAAAAAN